MTASTHLTRAQHYLEAERLLAEYRGSTWPDAPDIAALPVLAQVHATLAAVDTEVERSADERVRTVAARAAARVRHIVDPDSLETGQA